MTVHVVNDAIFQLRRPILLEKNPYIVLGGYFFDSPFSYVQLLLKCKILSVYCQTVVTFTGI